MTFLKAMLTHLKLETETVADFRKGYAMLTEQDKSDLKLAFEAEGVTIDG